MSAPSLAIEMASQVKLLLYSLLVGAALGAFFDLLRITRTFLACPPYLGAVRFLTEAFRTAVAFFEDILFFAVSAATLVLFCFKTNYGSSRAYMLISAAIGFFLYLNTLGRLTALLSGAVSRLLWKLVGVILNLLIMPTLGFIRRLVLWIYKYTLGRLLLVVGRAIGRYSTKRSRRRLVRTLRGLFTE